MPLESVSMDKHLTDKGEHSDPEFWAFSEVFLDVLRQKVLQTENYWECSPYPWSYDPALGNLPHLT